MNLDSPAASLSVDYSTTTNQNIDAGRDSNRSDDDEAAKRRRQRRTKSGESLVRFFAEVGVVKAEMEDMKKSMKLFENGGDDGGVNNWEHVINKARAIQTKLQSLDAANEENRLIQGCEAGSSTDRTRLSIITSLRSEVSTIATSFTPLLQHHMAVSDPPNSSHSPPSPHLRKLAAELHQIFIDIALPPLVSEHQPPHLSSVAETPPSTADVQQRSTPLKSRKIKSLRVKNPSRQ